MEVPSSYTASWLLLALALFATRAVNSAPALSIVNNEIGPEDDADGISEDEDDFTTRGLERLSSAATCLVAGVEYTHGQQIYRADQCEFCLCLDGEMFCWWQDCPPTMEGPCKDRGPFTPCSNNIKNNRISTSTSTTTTSPTMTHESSANIMTSTDLSITNTTSNNFTDATNYVNEESSTDGNNEEDETTSTEFVNLATSTQEPKLCVIMGRKYQIGDKLPHNTGNCIECICGPRAKVSCSPYQCAPEGEDINDYRPPGPRQQLPDVF